MHRRNGALRSCGRAGGVRPVSPGAICVAGQVLIHECECITCGHVKRNRVYTSNDRARTFVEGRRSRVSRQVVATDSLTGRPRLPCARQDFTSYPFCFGTVGRIVVPNGADFCFAQSTSLVKKKSVRKKLPLLLAPRQADERRVRGGSSSHCIE